jgi:hypothetical protein
VTLNTSPAWSNWTVDQDPTVHAGLDTVELASGVHTIHFTGNPHFHADKTITIDVGAHDVKQPVVLEETAPGGAPAP